MFKSVMRGSRENKETEAKLFDEFQALKLRGVDDLDTQWMKLDVTMYRVIKHLEKNKGVD